MNLLLAITHHSGLRIAEVGFLLMLIAGIWIAAERLPGLRFASGRSAVAGLLLAIGALLLIIATHWGHFG
jgi:hypothetical protein